MLIGLKMTTGSPHLHNQTIEGADSIYRIRCLILDFMYDPTKTQLELNITSNIAFNFVVSLIAILLNCLISYIMLLHRKYQTPSYFLLLQNSILDAIFPTTLVSWNVILLQVMDRNTHCMYINTSLYIGYVFGSVSMIYANMMATDRYLAIFRPFYYHERIVVNYKTYGPYITASWFFSVAIVGLSLLTPDFTMFYAYAALSLTASITFGSFVSIRIRLLVRDIIDKTDYPSLKHRAREQRRRKHEYFLNRLTTAMIFVLLASYVPFTIYSMIELTAPKCLTPYAYGGVLWAYTFIYIKSIANPLLFCVSMSTLRRDIVRLVWNKDNMIRPEVTRTGACEPTVTEHPTRRN